MPRESVCACQAGEGKGLGRRGAWGRMRKPAVLATVLLTLLAAAAVASGNTVSGHRLTGTAVLQEWHLYSFWANTTAVQNLVVDWRESPTFPTEDLSVTIYKPGTFDRLCPGTRDERTIDANGVGVVLSSGGDCFFAPSSSDTYAYSTGCPGDGVEGGVVGVMPLGRYDVFVEGNIGVDVPYKVSSTSGDLVYRLGMTGAIAVFIPPC